MVVYPGPVYYQGIDQQRLREIALKHLRDGVPIQAYFWRGAPLRVRSKITGTYDSGYKERPAPPINRPGTQDTKPKRNTRQEDVDDFKW